MSDGAICYFYTRVSWFSLCKYKSNIYKKILKKLFFLYKNQWIDIFPIYKCLWSFDFGWIGWLLAFGCFLSYVRLSFLNTVIIIMIVETRKRSHVMYIFGYYWMLKVFLRMNWFYFMLFRDPTIIRYKWCKSGIDNLSGILGVIFI